MSEEHPDQLSDASTSLTELWSLNRFLLIGEIHGTAEVPALISDVIRKSPPDSPVMLLLELPRDLDGDFREFFERESEEEARKQLTTLSFWTTGPFDGRSSQAMMELFIQLYRLHHSGRTVSIRCFDVVVLSRGEDRDQKMAEQLAKIVADTPSNTRILGLVGNAHLPTSATERHHALGVRPMGAWLRDLGVPFEPVFLTHDGGSAWVCAGKSADSCGVHPVAPTAARRHEIDSSAHFVPIGSLSSSAPVALSD